MQPSSIQTTGRTPAQGGGFLARVVIAAPILILAGAVIFFSFPELFARGTSLAAWLFVGEVLALIAILGGIALVIRDRSSSDFRVSSFAVIASVAVASVGLGALTFYEKAFRGLLSDASILTIIFCLVIGLFGGLVLAISRKRMLWLLPTAISALLCWYGFLLAVSIGMGRWH